MKVVFSKECLKYSHPGHPESPARVELSSEYLEKKGFSFVEPEACSEEDILLVHSKKLLEDVKGGDFLDMDTPALDNIFYYAALSAGAAVKASLLSIEGESALSLMRPPGHHATRDRLGGFCYFNNIAIAVMKAKERVPKVAIVDLDCHHGNGTQDIFLGKRDILYVSLHQSPLYPGTGLESVENCLNYPLAANTSPGFYFDTLNKALEEVMRFNPDLIAVSMGFDTYRLDPLTAFVLDKEDYLTIGRLIKKIGKPIFSVLEGGYNTEGLPECIENFLKGIG